MPFVPPANFSHFGVSPLVQLAGAHANRLGISDGGVYSVRIIKKIVAKQGGGASWLVGINGKVIRTQSDVPLSIGDTITVGASLRGKTVFLHVLANADGDVIGGRVPAAAPAGAALSWNSLQGYIVAAAQRSGFTVPRTLLEKLQRTITSQHGLVSKNILPSVGALIERGLLPQVLHALWLFKASTDDYGRGFLSGRRLHHHAEQKADARNADAEQENGIDNSSMADGIGAHQYRRGSSFNHQSNQHANHKSDYRSDGDSVAPQRAPKQQQQSIVEQPPPTNQQLSPANPQSSPTQPLPPPTNQQPSPANPQSSPTQPHQAPTKQQQSMVEQTLPKHSKSSPKNPQSSPTQQSPTQPLPHLVSAKDSAHPYMNRSQFYNTDRINTDYRQSLGSEHTTHVSDYSIEMRKSLHDMKILQNQVLPIPQNNSVADSTTEREKTGHWVLLPFSMALQNSIRDDPNVAPLPALGSDTTPQSKDGADAVECGGELHLHYIPNTHQCTVGIMKCTIGGHALEIHVTSLNNRKKNIFVKTDSSVIIQGLSEKHEELMDAYRRRNIDIKSMQYVEASSDRPPKITNSTTMNSGSRRVAHQTTDTTHPQSHTQYSDATVSQHQAVNTKA